MLDFSLIEMAAIGVVALVVIGPARLPMAARMVGRYVGKAQRYVRGIRAEIERSAELHDLQKMKQELVSSAKELEQSARELEQQIGQDAAALKNGIHAVGDAARQWDDEGDVIDGGALANQDALAVDSAHATVAPVSSSECLLPRRNWRSRRAAVPAWYRQRNGLRGRIQSGAARAAQRHTEAFSDPTR